MKKITVLLFNDFTNDNRVLKECRSLQSNGYDVKLVATHFDKNLPKDEEIEGFSVKRFNVGHFNFLPINLLLFWFHIVKNYRKENIFHCNDLYALPPAYIIKKICNKNAKIVYDCHEHETEAKIYIKKGFLKKLAQFFERKMIYEADSVITVSKSIAEDYARLYGINEPKLVLNSPVFETIKRHDLFREELKISKDKEIFLFQGKYLPGRGLDNLIEIFEKLEKVNRNIVLVFLIYGEGSEVIKKRIERSKNIYWHEKVSVMEYMKYVASADWGIYLMENICKNHDYALPNKIFDYILGGLPVVVSNLKEISSFVEKHNVGYTIDPNDEEKVINMLKDFDKNTKRKFLPNLKQVGQKYCWEEQEKVLLKIYKSL
ncbi:MAG: Glycosyltransferase [Candidatus Moranbacteria bacterium GW2011_GWD2_37_9]|uniref:Glycosyltransferase n=1 Tax=Candidatus Nomurabacteria bacterium GW2011_GWE1_35_16 TaxID=1618761 RepID=A0A0G0DSL3_9BACT|nr:MAG: Glycosyltransferase [Candidatus Nomurabacteria bacterium GW2011_GWE1_35_16]KKQ47579.1 MAG: Glycosyltransferase [Candidatus Moranbacteria bacterium GW2011_GWD2_37_9]